VAGRGSRGLALVSVLWITALLALLAASLTSSSRTESRLARNQIENAKAEALADAGVHRAALGLLQFDPERAWQADRRTRVMRLGEGEVRITIEDEDAKIDLNGAPVELLAGLFRAVGLDEEAALTFADRIADFRDGDDEPRPLGAEAADYAAAGLPYGPKNAPFVSLSELLQVLGMTEELYELVKPHLTVFSGGEGLDPLRASPTVLLAIPGMTPDIAQAIATAGADVDPFALMSDDLLFEIETYFLFSREIVFLVRAEGRSAGGGVFVREAVIELTGADPPFNVYAWRRGDLR
jgi:general secretion pathway protein K